MNNPLDKLFKDKLADHSLPPPSQAWPRIEASLSKKNNGFFKFRIAAALLVLGALVTTLVLLTERNTSNHIGLSQDVPAKKQVPVKETPPTKIEGREIAPLPADLNKKKAIVATRKVAEKINSAEVKQVQTPVEGQSLSMQANESPIALTEEEKPVVQEKIEKAIVIEYRLETVVVPPVAAETQPVASVREKSGFRKVLDFALEAKNSSPLGDLREQKDKLLAFNKKEKTNR